MSAADSPAMEAQAFARIFVSYARQDQHAVRRWCDALGAEGRALWVDWEGIAPSAEWMAEIETGIRTADAFVFMLSPTALASTVCRQELDIAVNLNKRLVPVVVKDVSPAQVPEELAKLNWIFLRDGDDATAGLAALTTALDTDLDWLQRHTALMSPALAWQDAGHERSRLLKGQALKQAEMWLTESARKSPPPADVQLGFIQASQQAARTRLRLALGGAVIGIVSLLVLTSWALVAERQAELARKEAVARQLGSDAALVASEQAALLETSALLAIESWKRRPALGNDIPLRHALRLLPIPLANWSHPQQRIGAALFVDDARRVVYAEGERVHARTTTGDAAPTSWPLDSRVRSLVRCGAAGAFLARTASGQVHLWQNADTAPINLARAHAATCTADGRFIALGDAAGRVHLQDTENPGAAGTLAESLDTAVDLLKFSKGGRYLAASAGPRMRIWQLDDKRPVTAVKLRQPIVDIDFDPENERVMAAADSGAYLWQLPDARPIKRLGQITNVHRASFSPDGRRIALGVGDGSVVLYHARRLERVARMQHQNPVHHLQFSADSRLLLSAGNDNTARLWSLYDGSEQLRFVHEDFVTAIDWAAGTERILTAGRDGQVRVWQATLPDRTLENGPSRVAGEGANVAPTRVLPDAGYLLESLGRPHWQLRVHGDTQPVLRFDEDADISTFAVSADGGTFALARFDGTVDLRQLPLGTPIRTLDIGAPIDTLGFSPDGQWLLTGSQDSQVRLWSWREGTVQWQQAHAPFIFSHGFSPDGRLVATGGSDRSARVWKTGDGSERLQLAHRHDVRAVAFHPQAPIIATASSDHLARLWSLETGKALHYLQHRNPVLALAFSPDGALLATGSSDDTARIWRLSDGQEQSRINTPAPVLALGIKGTRLRLYTGGEWSIHALNTTDVVTTTCKRLSHNLGMIDWLRYVGPPPADDTCPGLLTPRF
ncbi:toll/interleukin-1 receptor domain-containing protein [Sedimenticola hydrogenitrophicus]|uniref:toll/interleukin-1 receptor domain-containing protein n=1 Tax=Sedimenticola hydrogenitrophicus TaxID=2967975 RepID=UPI0021A5EFCF|nr:TIR domain-containing protein [Sedimenticola hydrogenitrophicus]